MKKIFLPISIFSALIFMGCSAGSSNESVSENIAIEDTAVADSMESEEELQITFPDTCKRRQVRTSDSRFNIVLIHIGRNSKSR